MGLLFLYKSICRAFAANANVVKAELREKVQKYYFFILYNNVNFYKHVCNAQMFNQGAQINYIISYICFMKPTNTAITLR